MTKKEKNRNTNICNKALFIYNLTLWKAEHTTI